MSPETRFHALIVAITVSIMFALISAAQPLLQNQSYKAFGPGLVVSLLTSAGVYKMLASVSLKLARENRWLKKMILGPSYLEGTWVGVLVGKSGDRRITVEHYEQNPFEVMIRGNSFTEQGDAHATWDTHAASLAVSPGLLHCFYNTRILSSSFPVEGIGKYQLIRSSPGSPANKMTGYVVDTDNGVAMWFLEIIKLSDTIMDPKDAFCQYSELRQQRTA